MKKNGDLRDNHCYIDVQLLFDTSEHGLYINKLLRKEE
jgi:hypothetical protein